MERLQATRVLRSVRRGSSWPVVALAGDRHVFTKLRGAAQGIAPLIAEVIVAGLAEALGLRVPARTLVRLEVGVATEDPDQELGDLLRASAGWNLGFAELVGARDFGPGDLARVDREVASRILWLDGLVSNEDRGPRNPNLMIDGGGLWLIDHGAALGFHHDWPALREDSPRRRYAPALGHVLAARATAVAALDGALAALLPRERLAAIVDAVPVELLGAAPAGGEARSEDERIARRRAAYSAYLWKRLKPPRPFLGD